MANSKSRAGAAADTTKNVARTRKNATATIDPTAGPVPVLLEDGPRKSRSNVVKAPYATEAKEELIAASGGLPSTSQRAQRAKRLNAQFIAAEQQRRAEASAPETSEDEAITTGDESEFDADIEQALTARRRSQQREDQRRSSRYTQNVVPAENPYSFQNRSNPHAEIWLAEDTRNPTRQRKARARRFWILAGSLTLAFILILVAVLIFVVGQTTTAAVNTYQARHMIHANFGRGDETITAFVQDHKVMIAEVFAADPSKSHVYATADLRESGYEDAAHVTDQDITLEVLDLKGDGKPDVLINVQIAPGTFFSPHPQVMRWTLINDGKELKFAGSSTTSTIDQGGK
ncbi:hypothetical protein [Ktedonobacter racemifer]|uniref:Uncharacterized protein n=1 Tax=Ktedonobacter racemifer DSM 44963 TaxID=485913 RepID=D6U8S6_KTERA|nr:hypothetical protein [Ktedonobacter racemifer]EFH79636.1 hypothetical protein Krac_0114 [Ktedonobacter racemifer DSM 44963]